MTIQTNEELERWLSDNYFFEDGHVLKIETNPLRIQVGYNIEGNYEANSVRVIRAFTLQPDQIIDWTLPDNSEFVASVDRYIEFIENIDASPNIGLLFCTPLSFKLITNSFTVTENELINTVFKPWISHDEIYVTTSLANIPRPEYWVEKMRYLGHEIVFRYYGGGVRSPDILPYPDYSGYYIQFENRIDQNREGIFIAHVGKNETSISLRFENKDQELKSVWIDLTRVLSELPDVIIKSGNCKFDGLEWQRYLDGGADQTGVHRSQVGP